MRQGGNCQICLQVMDRKRKAMDNDDGAIDTTDEEEHNSSEDLFADDASTAVNPVDSHEYKDEEMRSFAGVPAASLTSFTRFSPPPQSPRVTILVRWPKESCTHAFEPHPHANSARDSWDDQHVRMPFSKESVFPVSEPSGRKTLKHR